MTYLFLCRVCLSGNLKINFIQNTSLQVIYEKLSSYKLTTDDGRPEAVCYICLSQLQTFGRIADKSQKSEEILTQLFDNNIKILQETVAILNTGIQQDFCTTPVEAYSSQDGAKVTVKQEQLAVNEEPVTIRNDLVKKDKNPSTSKDVFIVTPTLERNNFSVGSSKEVAVGADLCRICLGGEVRTHCISKTKLQAVYQNLTSTKLVSRVGRPEGVCYVCRSQLLKCRKFIIRSKKSENILTELFRNGIELTQETIAALNSRMKSSFVASPLQFITYCSYGSVCKERAKHEYIETKTVAKLGIALKDSTQRHKTPKQLKGVNVDTTPKQLEGMNVDTTPKQLEGMNVDTTPKQLEGMNVDTTPKQLEEMKVKTQPTKTTLKSLICNECGYECYSRQRFQNHSRLHDPKRPFVCEICSFRYSVSSHLFRHKRNVHKHDHRCRKCGTQFKNVRTMKMHALCHRQKSVKCERCSKVFKDKTAHQHHYRVAHPGGKRRCDRCPASFTSRRYLEDHILNLHGSTFPYYTCDICRKQFADKINIGRHMMFVHTKRVRYECDVCGMTCHNRTAITQHLKTHAVKKPFECSSCFKTFNYKSNLTLHLMNHTGEKPYPCQLCDKRFKDKHLLKMHIATHDKSRFNCDICNNKYSRKEYLKEHLETHITGVNNTYSCHKCGNEFSLYAQLKIHLYTHNKKPAKKKPWDTCKICHRQYSNLRNHMRSHTGEKPYSCHICGKRFSIKGNLTLHIKYHTGSRPFPCNMCDKRFARSDHLKVHLSTHNEEKPYICKVCNKCYSHKNQLKTHLRRHDDTEKIIYPCDQCDKKYSEKRSLDCHKTNYHSTDKKLYYICDYCFKVYTLKDDFIKHIRTHRKRAFSCDECKRSFRDMSMLSVHMNEHAADKSCVCSLCKKSFRRTTFSRHITFSHGSVKPYACNTCEEGFLQLHKAYNHSVRHHGGERPYSCDLCYNSYMRRFSLVKHYRNIHRRVVKF